MPLFDRCRPVIVFGGTAEVSNSQRLCAGGSIPSSSAGWWSRFLGGLAIAVLSACGTDGESGGRSLSVELAVMTFNIEYGGDRVDFSQLAEAVRAAGADVVGLQEAWGNIQRLAEDLGWAHLDTRMQVLSRYPLIDPGGAEGRYVLVELAPGRVVALGNVHLPSDPYGPSEVRDGASAEEVLALERRLRLPPLAAPLAALAALAEAGIPAFLTGDFNSPASGDWSAAAVGSRSYLRYPVDWPVSRAVAAAGFRDSYRELHPDVLTEPGLTWPAARPPVEGWNPAPDETRERIDFVFAAGRAETISSRLVGEPGAPDVEIALDPWPSDHRAVVSTFRVEPAPMPVLVAVERRSLTVGQPLRVVAFRPGGSDSRVIVRAAVGTPPRLVDERPVSGPAGGRAALEFPTAALASGSYEIVLLDAARRELATTVVWLHAPEEEPAVRLERSEVAAGEPIVAGWSAAPGNRWDWIGVYAADGDPGTGPPLLWRYTGATIAGSTTLDATAEGGVWPLEPGAYRVALFVDDGYESVASALLTVTQ